MARDFTGGSSDRADVGTFSVVTNVFTMGCWLFIDSFDVGRDDRFISKADGTAVGNHDWMLGKTDSTGAKIRARANRMSNSGLTVVGATTVTTAAWHHALMTYDGTGTNPIITVFLDGVQDGQGSGATNETGNLPNNLDAVYIGNQPTAATSAPDGRIAEAFVVGALASANQIAALARGVSPKRIWPHETTLRYWPLDGVFSPEPDLGVNRNDGTLTGTARANHAPVASDRILMPSTRVIGAVAAEDTQVPMRRIFPITLYG